MLCIIFYIYSELPIVLFGSSSFMNFLQRQFHHEIPRGDHEVPHGETMSFLMVTMSYLMVRPMSFLMVTMSYLMARP